MHIVIKIGGSLAISRDGPNVAFFKKLIPILKKIREKNSLALVIGGGPFVRAWYKKLKKLGLENHELELIGIELLHAAAKLLATLIDGTAVSDLNDITNIKLPVVGGIAPGRSTDANAALVAEKLNADLLLKLTDVDGIYTADPKKDSRAKKIDHLSFNDALKFAVKPKPGSYGILDPLALKVIKRSRIKTIVLSGKNPARIFDALAGKKVGTVIC